MFVYSGFSEVVNLNNVTQAALKGDSSGKVLFYLVGADDPVEVHMASNDPDALVNLQRLTASINPATYIS